MNSAGAEAHLGGAPGAVAEPDGGRWHGLQSQVIRRGPSVRQPFILGCVVLAIQLGLVGYEHLGSTWYFAWAPNDYVVQYTLRVT